MKTLRSNGLSILATALMAGMLAGCFGSLGNLNPFAERETPLPGERIPVVPQPVSDVAGGTPTIGGSNVGADWPQPGGNAANNPGNAGLAGGAGQVVWTSRAGGLSGRKAPRTAAPPIVVGSTIFAYQPDGKVTALSSGGGQSWSVSLTPEDEKSQPVGGGVASAGNAIIAATGFGEVVALNPSNGGRIWTYELDAPARSAPTSSGGKVYVVTTSNVLHAINVSDGSEAWTFPGIPETAGVLSAASPAVSGSSVVVPYSSGEIIAFNSESGNLMWADAVVRASRTLAVSGFTDVAASPVIADGIVYATGVAGRTIAVRLANGERLWEANIGSASTPAVSGNAIFLIDLQDNMIALNRQTGEVFWRTALPVVRKKRFFSVWSGPTLAGSQLWAVSNDRKIIAVDPGTGNITLTRDIRKPGLSKPIVAGGRLFVELGDGAIAAVQ